VVAVHQPLLAANDRLAERNRGYFRALGLLTINVVSSPGSGKTTLIQETVARLGSGCRAGVIVGDLETDNDARRLRAAGARAVQITTGTLCHLEAGMIARALAALDPRSLELLIIENVGNLVCPAAFDLGEDLRVVLLSVTEGEDKPLKYPPMFSTADVVIVTKLDLAAAAGVELAALRHHIQRASPRAQVFEVSARTGAGMEPWCEFLLERRRGLGVGPGV
jgi:hydrogenase nickel incorporation protein HypB